MTNHPAYSSTQTELRFVYDAEHRRVQKIISENGIPVDVTAFIYDDFKVIATLDSSGNPKQTFHWTHEGPGGLLALTDHRTSPRQTHLAGYDGRGNLTTLLNAADASLSAAYEYSPFGEVIRATGPYAPQNPVGFSTTWTDRTTHLNYYGYRFYHPAEGRFLNQDPIEEQGGNNLYAAFSGDPVNRWDFRGLSAIAISVPQRLDAIRESDIRTQFRAEVYELPPHTVRPYCPPGTVAINNWLGGVDCASTTGANFLQPYPGHQNEEGGGDLNAIIQINDQAQKEDQERRDKCAGIKKAMDGMQSVMDEAHAQIASNNAYADRVSSSFAEDPWVTRESFMAFRRDILVDLPVGASPFDWGLNFYQAGWNDNLSDLERVGHVTVGLYRSYEFANLFGRNASYFANSVVGKASLYGAVGGLAINAGEKFSPNIINKIDQQFRMGDISDFNNEKSSELWNKTIMPAWNNYKMFEQMYNDNNCSDFE